MIKRAFTEHPASVGESYFQHMGMAFGFGAKMVCTGAACLLHGLFPFLFVRTGSRCIEDLHGRMVIHRDRRECTDSENGSPTLATDNASMHAAE
ncbi:MAG: hypothetical protein GXP04_04030 [Alphaproteobacteria bacterium]|nr:hypothetical protein [Marinicaulis sp.]NOX94276.1 hypothetical protein [Alphaproteobacteria bacterium]